jgi:hypothetical protein
MSSIVAPLVGIALLAALDSTATAARPHLEALATMASGQALRDRPPAPEVWSFRVEYRTRRGPQFRWGRWRKWTTITGDYNTGKMRAKNVADFIEELSRNHQARIIERRIR